MDPGPTTIEIPGKTALLLLQLAEELGVESPGQVVAQALGVLKMCRDVKARGMQIVARDRASGRDIELAV